MDIKTVPKNILSALKKYKYAILVLLIGLALMMIPTGKSGTQSTDNTDVHSEIRGTLSEELREILKRIDGAGDVQVMLTVKSGEEVIYYENEDITTSGDSNTVQKSVVTVTDADKNQEGLIIRIDPAKYLGAIVVCQGADSASVRYSIMDAVSKVTGLSSDRISILKMK